MKDTKKVTTKKWLVAARQVETFTIWVEAKTEEEAEKKAGEIDIDEWHSEDDCVFPYVPLENGILIGPWIVGEEEK